VALQFCNETGDVDDCHAFDTTVSVDDRRWHRPVA
jgi:hypothetical protein